MPPDCVSVRVRDPADGSLHGGFGAGLVLQFSTREPGGTIASFDIDSGSVRDLALNGNVLLMTAARGWLLRLGCCRSRVAR